MDKKIFKKTLHYELHEKLKTYRFNKKTGDNVIKRVFEHGIQTIQLHYIDHEEDFDVVLYANVRFDQIEEIKQRGRQDLSEQQKKRIATITVQYGHLKDLGQHRWTIKTEEDAKKVAHSLFEAVEETILPYLEKHSNMSYVLTKCLQEDVKETLLFQPFDHVRAMNAVALAVVLQKDESCIAQIIEEKTRYLSKDQVQLQQFLNFVEQLNK